MHAEMYITGIATIKTIINTELYESDISNRSEVIIGPIKKTYMQQLIASNSIICFFVLFFKNSPPFNLSLRNFNIDLKP